MIAARRQENIVLHSFGEALSVLFVLLADKTGWLTVLFLSPLNCTLWQPETVFTASTLEQFAEQLCHCRGPRFIPRSKPVWWGNAMQCHAVSCNACHDAPGILGSWNLKQTILILALTLTGRLITLVLRVQKAGLFIWSTKFRYVNSAILLECCRIAIALQLVVPGQKPRRCILRCWFCGTPWHCGVVIWYI